MAIIIVKKSRKPEFLRGNSANRRHARRKAEAIATKNVKMKLEEIFRTEPDKSPMSRVEKATSACSTPIYDSPDNCCLNTTALYSTKRYKSKPKTEFGITARAQPDQESKPIIAHLVVGYGELTNRVTQILSVVLYLFYMYFYSEGKKNEEMQWCLYMAEVSILSISHSRMHTGIEGHRCRQQQNY